MFNADVPLLGWSVIVETPWSETLLVAHEWFAHYTRKHIFSRTQHRGMLRLCKESEYRNASEIIACQCMTAWLNTLQAGHFSGEGVANTADIKIAIGPTKHTQNISLGTLNSNAVPKQTKVL